MIPLYIDASNFIDQSSLSQDEITSFHDLLLSRLEKGFKNEWENEVNENLHSTREEYRRGMYSDHPDNNTVIMGVIAMRSRLAVNLELGMDAFDEKQYFAQSPKRTIKKNGKGWYITVPFRSATSTALGESPAFTSVMPAAIERLAKKSTKPLTLHQLPTGFQNKGIRPTIQSGGKTFPAYQRKTARYEGLVRLLDKDENRGGYFTFRRVSDLSDANSWIHPGLLPRGLLKKALENTDIERIILEAKNEFFKNNR